MLDNSGRICNCAVCGKRVAKPSDILCMKCFKEHDKESGWVKALIKLETRNRYVEFDANKFKFQPFVLKTE